MREDHNIDRLFQESFKDFEVEAPKNAWRNIEKSLTSKRKKKIVPLWQRFSGVAAIIAVIILAGSQWFGSSILNTNSVVDSSEQLTSPIINTENEQYFDVDSNSNIPVVSFDNIEETDENELMDADKQFESKASNIIQKQSISPKNNSNYLVAKSSKSLYFENQDQFNPSKSYTKQSLAEASSLLSKNVIVTEKGLTTNSIQLEQKFAAPQPQLKSLVEVAALIDQEKISTPKKSKKNWYVKPQISPIFYGNLGSGSAIDQSFNQNSSQGEVNVSYGMNVAYQLNERIKVRTGLNRVNLNYSTNDVYLLPGEGMSSFSNVNISNNFESSVVTSTQLEMLDESGNLGRFPTESSELQQQLGYLEVPMELEYKLIDKTIDINLIGGASTLFLNDNSLDIQTGSSSTFVGEANNINNISFSTNLAIGFDYDISEKFIFNLEPTFKYQFNTFEGGTTDFQPYFLGVYTGVIFKF